MVRFLDRAELQDGDLRFSRYLARFHIGGIILLVLVVVSSVLWLSARHNELARESSERMVSGGISAFKVKMQTVVKDYSIWDEAYNAIRADDFGWLYSNIGTGAAEIGALDKIVIIDPLRNRNFGWRQGSPQEGESDLLPPELVATMVQLLVETGEEENAAQSAFELLGDEPWSFAITRVIPVGGLPDGVSLEDLPMQIHGLHMTRGVLDGIGANLLMDDLALSKEPLAERSAVPLISSEGEAIAYVDWIPPRPGASILRQIALPLGLALAVVAAIAVVSSRFAVRSAARLEQALIDAQAADRMKTEFLSNVSHELRTPMNGIVGVAQLLQMTELDEEQRELVGVLASSADTQMSLISDLLDLTRMESGNRQLQIARFEPGQVVRDTVEMVRPLALDKNIALELELAPLDGLAVLGDGRAFRQIMTNLVGNAAKFTDRGSILVRGEVTRTGDEAELVLKVRDTGRGIPPEHQRRIFDRFYQVDGSQTRDAGGTGLGLAISQSLGHMMGGHIEVQSTPGVGSTFTFRVRLPVAPADAALQNAA
jgi:signal transduction histidine kinase